MSKQATNSQKTARPLDGENPAGSGQPAKAPRSIFKTLALISYVVLGIFVILLFALMKTSFIGWMIAIPLLLLSAAIQFTVVKKGCVTGFILFFITTAVLMGTFLLTARTNLP